MMDIRQTENLYITLSGAAATDIVCIGGRARERLSTISELRFEFVSKVTTFEPASMLGEKITLETGDGFKFSGIVIEVEDVGLQAGGDVFAAEVRPWLWLAGIGEDNRIFQKMSTPDIITKVLGDMGFDAITKVLSGSYQPREYCVQYGESNLAFISRLMEEDGIFYHFDHSGSSEKLVLVDDSSRCSDAGEIPFTVRNMTKSARADSNSIYEWAEVGRVVSGKVTLWDYDFTKPNANLVAGASVASGNAEKDVERYQSDGHYKTADEASSRDAKYIAEAYAAEAARSTGLASSVKVRCGQTFTLKYDDRQAVEGSYLTVAATHYFRFDDGPGGTELLRRNRGVEIIEYPELMKLYETEFEVLKAATPFRPQKVTPWPEVPGLLTAIVTGPEKEEIHTDEYGRIKIQFPWDREGKKNDLSSCWVRTVMPWAGNGYGFVAIPRVGMEVVIQFERGNIDRPICTGMVYNGMNKPPYTLPGDMNKVSLRSNSTKDAGEGHYHELTMDDTYEKEKVLFQSERDYEQIVKQNATIRIGMDMDEPKKGDLTQTIKNSKTEDLEEGDWTLNVKKGNRVAKVKTDDTTTVEGKSTTTITGDTALTVKSGNVTEKVESGNVSTEVSQGNHTTKVSLGNVSISADAGKVTIEAAQSIELKVNGSSIKITPTGVKIVGAVTAAMEGGVSAGLKGGVDAKVEGGVKTDITGSAMVKIQGGMTMIN